MEGGGRVDVELPVNRKVLWDRGADKIQLNKPNRPGALRTHCTSHSYGLGLDQYAHHSIALPI